MTRCCTTTATSQRPPEAFDPPLRCHHPRRALQALRNSHSRLSENPGATDDDPNPPSRPYFLAERHAGITQLPFGKWLSEQGIDS